MTEVLAAQNVTKVFKSGLFHKSRTVALEDFSLSINESPTFTAVAGESGSGKTTLARLLIGVISPTFGKVTYRGKSLQELSRSEWKLFRKDVQAVFQDPYGVYNPFYKVDHALTVTVDKFKLARSRRQGRELIEEALRAVGLRPEETLGRYPHELSGGQRQRIMVARALLPKPRIIVADEPVSMVDASLRATILRTLVDLNTNLGISILFITHDLTTAYRVSDHIIILYGGSIAEAGTVESVIKNPRHPYTRLLVGSVPVADPDRKWGHQEIQVASSVPDSSNGCKFADRCTSVMAICRQTRPPLFQTDKNSAAACFLYKTEHSISVENLRELMAVKV